jgi:integrase/recombinase XerD
MTESLQAFLMRHYLPSTVKNYEQDIAMYLRYNPDAAGAVYGDITRYIGLLRERYSNTGTVSRIVSSLKVYYAYLCYAGIRDDNPARAIRLRGNKSAGVQLQDLLSREELEGLLERGSHYGEAHDYRYRVMIGLMIYQALLPGEIAAMRVGDIDLLRGEVNVRATGNSNGRKLPLRPGQVMLMHIYLRQWREQLLGKGQEAALLIRRGGGAMTMVEISQQVRRCCAGRYGDKRINARVIRQSVIADLLRCGHDVSVVQLFAGHKLPDATQRYKPEGLESLRSALDRYHPLQ